MAFRWDPKKAAKNWRKHRVSFDEAASALSDLLAVHEEDEAHDDKRQQVIGMSERGRLLFVICLESDGAIRIISARKATPHERRRYEEEQE